MDTKDESSLPVKQFQYTDWPEKGVPDTGSGLIDLIGQVQKWQRSCGPQPVVVHCRYGTGRGEGGGREEGRGEEIGGVLMR